MEMVCNNSSCNMYKNKFRNNEKFCPMCGSLLEVYKKKKLAYKYSESAVYQVTMTVTKIFLNEDNLKECIGYSSFGEDGEFDSYEFKKLKSDVTIEQWPYICGNCSKIVTDDTECDCSVCDSTNWLKREE